MARKQISVGSAFIYCINHDHGRGPQRSMIGYPLDEEDVAAVLADAEILASQEQGRGDRDHMAEFRMELTMDETKAVDDAYDRMSVWLSSKTSLSNV